MKETMRQCDTSTKGGKCFQLYRLKILLEIFRKNEKTSVNKQQFKLFQFTKIEIIFVLLFGRLRFANILFI